MSNYLLSFILIILVGLVVTQVGTLSANALTDPTIGIKASSTFGTLQIDHSEYDVTYVNSTVVNVSGIITSLQPGETKVTILFILPDGSTKGSQIAPNSDNTFQTSLPLDSTSQKGTWSVSASYNVNTIGALTFTVRQVPVSHKILSPHTNLSQSRQSEQQTNPNSVNATNGKSLQNVINEKITAGNKIKELNQTQSIPSKIPNWLKNNVKYWYEGSLGDEDFVKGVKYLIDNKIIKTEQKTQTSGQIQSIPKWVKNNAGMWADGSLSDDDFLKGIEYLVKIGIVPISISPVQTNSSSSITSSSQVPLTTSLFPKGVEVGSGWTFGNLTLSNEPGGEYLEEYNQMLTNNNDGKKTLIQIAKYQSIDKATEWYQKAKSLTQQFMTTEISPDSSIGGNCFEADSPTNSGNSNGQESTQILCQKDIYLILENGYFDNSSEIKQDMTKLTQIILNKIPGENNKVNSQTQTASITTDNMIKSLQQILPQRKDIDTIWTISDPSNNQFSQSEYTYVTGLGMSADSNNYQDEARIQGATGYLNGLVEKYSKNRDSGGTIKVWVVAYKFDTKDNAEKYYKDFTGYVYNRGGFEGYDTSNVGAECFGTFQSGEVADSINIYCTKSDVYYHVLGMSDQMLFDEDKQAITKFAQIIANNS